MPNILSTIVWSKKLDIDDKTYPQKFIIDLDLEKYKEIDKFGLLFDASGAGSDTWKFNNLEIRVYLTN